jgi:hypothetical protein
MKIMFGIPSTGWIRFEFFAAQTSLVIPTNWGNIVSSPIGYDVADARNHIVESAMANGVDWLFFIDHDVILPPDTLIKLRQHMFRKASPVVAGLYYAKGSDPEPLIYRGRSNGPYYDWDPGDTVWVDGVPMGCTMIHTSLFRIMEKPWFESPRRVSVNAQGQVLREAGTEDLYWCDRVIKEGLIEKTGIDWGVKDPLNPFIMDTNIFCQHIDLKSGKQYPGCRPESDWKDVHMAYRARMNKQRKKTAKAARK